LLPTFYTLSFLDYIHEATHLLTLLTLLTLLIDSRCTHATNATHATHLHQPTQLTIYIYIYIYIITGLGPMAKPRKCRDVMCMVLFVLCWILWLLLVWTTITDGCPDKYVSVSVPSVYVSLCSVHPSFEHRHTQTGHPSVSFLYVSLCSVRPSFVSTPSRLVSVCPPACLPPRFHVRVWPRLVLTCCPRFRGAQCIAWSPEG
jgi:hypothetical protein